MPMIIGYKKAREQLYFGDPIDAKTAFDLGMVNRVVPLAELREASLTFAKRLQKPDRSRVMYTSGNASWETLPLRLSLLTGAIGRKTRTSGRAGKMANKR